MSIRIPLRYSNREFAYALVDEDCEPLSLLGYFSVTLPRKLRSVTGGRPDVILAYLREDSTAVGKCKPFLSTMRTQILLVHMVIRGEIGRLVRSHIAAGSPNDYQETLSQINQIRGAIGRIVYVNSDCTDCRRDNLREV